MLKVYLKEFLAELLNNHMAHLSIRWLFQKSYVIEIECVTQIILFFTSFCTRLRPRFSFSSFLGKSGQTDSYFRIYTNIICMDT